jgi:hypothetical protein
MFRFDAFGQRVPCSPRLSYMAPKPDPSGGGTGADDDVSVELDGEKFAFPAGTAVKDMTPDQAAEYWRHEAKKQQKKAPKKPADYDKLQADSAELARIRAEQTPEEQRKEQERLDEARREGENIGAERYLKDAVQGKFQALTGMKDEDADKVFAHLDVRSFVDDEGNLDTSAITEYASTHGSAGDGGGHGPDPVRDSVNRQRPAGGGGGGQSMKERREATAARLTKKKQTDN